MEEYLTDKWRQPMGLRLALGSVALLFGCVFASVGMGFLREGDTGTSVVSAALALLCFWPAVRTARACAARRQARLLANCFAGVEEPGLRLDVLRGRVPIRDPAGAVSALVAAGYLRNCTVDLGRNSVLFHGPSRVPEEGDFAAMECPGCGAVSSVQKGRVNHCAFCGTALSFPGEEKGAPEQKPRRGKKNKENGGREK